MAKRRKEDPFAHLVQETEMPSAVADAFKKMDEERNKNTVVEVDVPEPAQTKDKKPERDPTPEEERELKELLDFFDKTKLNTRGAGTRNLGRLRAAKREFERLSDEEKGKYLKTPMSEKLADPEPEPEAKQSKPTRTKNPLKKTVAEMEESIEATDREYSPFHRAAWIEELTSAGYKFAGEPSEEDLKEAVADYFVANPGKFEEISERVLKARFEKENGHKEKTETKKDENVEVKKPENPRRDMFLRRMEDAWKGKEIPLTVRLNILERYGDESDQAEIERLRQEIEDKKEIPIIKDRKKEDLAKAEKIRAELRSAKVKPSKIDEAPKEEPVSAEKVKVIAPTGEATPESLHRALSEAKGKGGFWTAVKLWRQKGKFEDMEKIIEKQEKKIEKLDEQIAVAEKTLTEYYIPKLRGRKKAIAGRYKLQDEIYALKMRRSDQLKGLTDRQHDREKYHGELRLIASDLVSQVEQRLSPYESQVRNLNAVNERREKLIEKQGVKMAATKVAVDRVVEQLKQEPGTRAYEVKLRLMKKELEDWDDLIARTKSKLKKGKAKVKDLEKIAHELRKKLEKYQEVLKVALTRSKYLTPEAPKTAAAPEVATSTL